MRNTLTFSPLSHITILLSDDTAACRARERESGGADGILVLRIMRVYRENDGPEGGRGVKPGDRAIYHIVLGGKMCNARATQPHTRPHSHAPRTQTLQTCLV